MENTKSKTKIGMILIILGLVILIINAVGYLSGFFGLSLEIVLPSSSFGIVLFITGYLFGWLYPTAKKKKKE
jgi:ABC-type antimicrobial peptide transport system permease subunit